MSRIGGVRKTNATLDAPGYGRKDVVVTTLGHGMSIVGSDGESRRFRAYYPFVRTSGAWYIEAVCAELRERDELHMWLLGHVSRCIDPYKAPLNPMTISVPSRNFVKVGYPTATLDFGDAFGRASYHTIINFCSASDPTVSGVGASRYIPPLRDSAARHFYPAGVQETTIKDPLPGTGLITGDDVWGGGGGGGMTVR